MFAEWFFGVIMQVQLVICLVLQALLKLFLQLWLYTR
jgi:hypothetical protein